MFQQPLRNFLLASLLNFFLKIFLVASKHFKVDIEPPNEIKPQATKRCLHSKILCLLGIVVIDETYVKVKGKWHYLFTACDGLRGFIISQHLSPHRDAMAALTILKEVTRRYDKREFIFVTDKAPIYEVAVHAAFDNKPPVLLKDKRGNQVDEWSKLLRWIAGKALHPEN